MWLFAPKESTELSEWARVIRSETDGKIDVWIQVGTVQEALQVMDMVNPDVLVLQSTDAGGHGLSQSASIISLLPEVQDELAANGLHDVSLLAAGGIVEARGVAAALTLGAAGVVMGTRFLAAREAGIALGWQEQILKASDGGISTKRSTLCDRMKGTVGWPQQYDGRALFNRGYADEESGMEDVENVRLYREDMGKEMKRGVHMAG